jgi:hypothetical protein
MVRREKLARKVQENANTLSKSLFVKRVRLEQDSGKVRDIVEMVPVVGAVLPC